MQKLLWKHNKPKSKRPLHLFATASLTQTGQENNQRLLHSSAHQS